MMKSETTTAPVSIEDVEAEGLAMYAALREEAQGVVAELLRAGVFARV